MAFRNCSVLFSVTGFRAIFARFRAYCTLSPTLAHVNADTLNPLKAELNPICHLLALLGGATIVVVSRLRVNVQNCIDINVQNCIDIKPLNAELNPICHLLALLGGATIVVVSRLRVNV